MQLEDGEVKAVDEFPDELRVTYQIRAMSNNLSRDGCRKRGGSWRVEIERSDVAPIFRKTLIS